MFVVLRQSFQSSDLVTRYSHSLDVVVLKRCIFVIFSTKIGNVWLVHKRSVLQRGSACRGIEIINQPVIQYFNRFALPLLWRTEVNLLISVLSYDLAKRLPFAQISLSNTIQKVCITALFTEQCKKYHHHHHHHQHYYVQRHPVPSIIIKMFPDALLLNSFSQP